MFQSCLKGLSFVLMFIKKLILTDIYQHLRPAGYSKMQCVCSDTLMFVFLDEPFFKTHSNVPCVGGIAFLTSSQIEAQQIPVKRMNAHIL